MSAMYHQLRGRLRPLTWIISILCLSFSILGSLHTASADVPVSTESPQNLETTQLQKLDSTGEVLHMDAQQWSCVMDKETGLTWEKRDPTTALHGHDTYVWYQPEQMTPGSALPHPDEVWANSTCYGFDIDDPNSFCNTNAYAERVNLSNYCGHSDWRLPTVTELLTLVEPERQQSQLSPLLDTRFFPFHDPFLFWTTTTNEQGVVLTIFDDSRVFANSERSDNISIRLVRGNIQ